MIVMKFGGTSVGSPEAMARAADIVATRAARQPIVIVSALSGVTDRLLEAAHAAGQGQLSLALKAVETLRERHEEVIAGTITAPTRQDSARETAGTHLAELSLILEALALLRNRGPRASDVVVSYGELLSAELLAEILEDRGLPGRFVDAREVMVTDATFGRASPDIEAIGERAHIRLAGEATAGRIPVMQGFVGATPEGTTTTLGRGGSDYTAALVGAALGVADVEIWTDVDGFMTADPRIVSSAHTLDEVSYDEAAELAYFGAKVLHPATTLPVIEHGIPVRILNSLRPSCSGTTIVPERGDRPGSVRSIASKQRVTTFTLRAPRMLGAHGFLARMFGLFDRYGVVVDVVTTSEVSVSLSTEDADPDPQLLEELSRLGDLTLIRNRAIICVVGEGLRDMPGLAARVFQAVQPFAIEMISLGASRINLTFIIDQVHAADAVRRLHDEFFPE